MYVYGFLYYIGGSWYYMLGSGNYKEVTYALL